MYNLLKNFFKSKNNNQNYKDFSFLNTDMHSHLLHGLDDGSPDLETSVKLVKELKKLGFVKLIITPHIMSDMYKNTQEIIKNKFIQLRNKLKENQINIKIEYAAEYYIDFEFEKKILENELLTFGENYILVECSFFEPPLNFLDIIFKLQLNGYKVILAHPERYHFFSIEYLENLVDRGVLLQLNLLSLIGFYSEKIRKRASLLVKKDMISFIGTDCHNIRQLNLLKQCLEIKDYKILLNSKKIKNSLL